MLESLFSKVAGPEACFSMDFAKLLRTRFYRTASVAATDYTRLYHFISNSNGTSLDKENYLELPRLYTDSANLYFSMNLLILYRIHTAG